MADMFSKEQRRNNMQKIKSISNLENRVTKELWKQGYRFRKNDKSLTGKPDISIKKYKVVIFIDSCFWHGCEEHGNIPKSNIDYWEKKLERNKQRDKEVSSFYLKNDWRIMRVWEHNLKSNFVNTIDNISKFIDSAKKA